MLNAESTNFMEIKITDANKMGGSINSYINYTVSTTSNMEGFGSGDNIVNRRYSDFVWISEQLAREYPGVVIPPIPEKETIGFSSFGMTSASKIDSRKRGLEKFLQRVAQHQQLAYSKSFTGFLSVQDLASVKSGAKSGSK